jgi:phage terminase large subunit GpA-like protein
MFEFASQEFVIPKGLHKGTLVNWDVQPFARLLVIELDNDHWRDFAIAGCVQSGKSLFAWVLPAMYYACECKDAIVIGAPTTKILHKKWRNEILPALNASRYRDLLPQEGLGSRGGNVEQIRLGNGGMFTFMSGGGGDENRSSDTVRCALITEADKMDTSGGTSREAPPTVQIRNRTSSYPENLRRYHAECTVSVPEGFIWQEIKKGSDSRIACPCPNCSEYVTPEREHLAGWQTAPSESEARRAAHFVCPACGEAISEEQRKDMNRRGVVIHRGQTVDADGSIHGDLPDSHVLGFRWNAFNNLFWAAGEIAAKEWNRAHATSGEEALEKELCQFVWAIPYESPDFDATPLDAQKVSQRFSTVRRYTKGVVPNDMVKLAMAIDCGSRFCTWTLAAVRPECVRHVVDYGTFKVQSDIMEVGKALLAALEQFRDKHILEGWVKADGEIVIPQTVFVDAGWKGYVVYEFCAQKQSGRRFRPAIGYGLSQEFRRYRTYSKPSKTGSVVKLIGEEYHVVWLPPPVNVFRVDFNADYWKTELFNALKTPPLDEDGNPVAGAMEFFYSTNPNEHMTVAKHYTAERPTEVFTPGKGKEQKWHKESRDNHYLDNGSNLFVAFHLLGARLIKRKKEEIPRATPTETENSRPFLGPDGRPYLFTERN